MDFQLQLLTRQKDKDTITGPMSPMGSAQEMVKQKLIPPFRQLWRVRFAGPAVNQVYEGPGRTGLTGYDTLVTYSPYKSKDVLAMYLDMGVKICPIALYFSDDSIYDLELAQVYENEQFYTKLTQSQVQEIMQEVHERAAIVRGGNEGQFQTAN